MKIEKSVVLCLAIFFVSLTTAQAQVKGKIERVTIYPSSALVEKSVKVRLNAGLNQIVIGGNSTEVAASGIHFSNDEDWFISSMSTELVSLPESQAAKQLLPLEVYRQYLTLKAKAKDLEQQQTDNNTLLAILEKQKAALSNLKAIKNTDSMDSVANIKAQFDFYVSQMTEIGQKYSKAKEKKIEIAFEKDKTDKQIENLISPYAGGKKILSRQNNIVLQVYSKKNFAEATLKYSYIVYNVSCGYGYDVMFDDKANTAVFNLKSSVWQNTGENWKDCEIVLSTMNAGYIGSDNELPVYYLDYNKVHAVPVAKMYKNSVVRSTNSMELYSEEKSTANMDGTIASSSGVDNLTLNREYTLTTKQSIASGEDMCTIPLYSEQTKVGFTRYCTPKFEPKVYYTALLPDWEDLNLQETFCDVYLNNKYVAKTCINTSNTKDTMRFSVGEDNGVKVVRKITKSSPNEKGLLAKEVEMKATISLVVKNTKDERVTLNLKDQVPVSANSEIKIVNVQKGGGEYEQATGLLRWDLTLEPREEKTISFSYTVRYSNGNEINLE